MQTVAQRTITEEERQIAQEDLSAARSALIAEISGVTEAQWTFQPSSECWSIAQNVEHLTTVEGRVAMRLADVENAEESEPGRNDQQIDAAVRRDVPNRKNRFKTPPHMEPSGRCTLAEALDEFERTHDRVLQRLNECTCLRGRVIPHPVAGLWDGYQWLLAAAAHTARHTAQIREIKTDPAFPIR